MPEELLLLKEMVEKETREALAPPAPPYVARSIYHKWFDFITDTALPKFCPSSYPPGPCGGPPTWFLGPFRRRRPP
jgi:hypothetical protein